MKTRDHTRGALLSYLLLQKAPSLFARESALAGVSPVFVSCLGQVKNSHEVEQLQAAGAAGTFSSEDKEVFCFSAAPSSRLEQKGGARAGTFTI